MRTLLEQYADTILDWTLSMKTVPETYLHMSVESWVPKAYSVEAILLMSSAAPEEEKKLVTQLFLQQGLL